jgi:hypothetical protein
MANESDAIARDLTAACLNGGGEQSRVPYPPEVGGSAGEWVGDFFAAVLRKVTAAQRGKVSRERKGRER